MATTVTHRSLDGGTVSITSDLDLDQAFSSVITVRSGSMLREFTAGPRDAAAANAESLGVKDFEEEYWFQSGRLRLGTTTQHDPVSRVASPLCVAIWEGNGFSLFTHMYHAKPKELLAATAGMSIAEHADGVTLEPGHGNEIADACVLKELPVVGLLDIAPATRQAVRELPAWSGKGVGGGELFTDEHRSQRIFLLAGSSAITRVIPHPGFDEKGALSALASLVVSWQAG